MRALLIICLTGCFLQADELSLLRGSLGILRKGGVATIREASPGSPVDQIAMGLPLTDERTPWRARFIASEWLLLAHLERLKMAPIPEVTSTQRDLGQAWVLIQNAYEQSQGIVVGTRRMNLYQGSDINLRAAATRITADQVGQELIPEGLSKAMTSLALEISVRLMQPDPMAKAAAYVATRTDLSPRDTTYALMAAVHGGAWKNAIRWALELQGARIFTALHQSALANPECFDYSVFAQSAVPVEPPGTFPTPTSRYLVKDFRLRLRGSQGSSAGGAALTAAFAGTWQGTGMLPNPLLRVGAAAHWQKPGATPVPLTGFASSSGISLCGYALLPSGGQRKESLSLAMDPDRPGTWTGRLVAEQPSAEGTFVAEFDVEMDLEAPA